LRVRGKAEETLRILKSLGDPAPEDVASRARLRMHLGYCSASLGEYSLARKYLNEADEATLVAGLPELLGEIKLRLAMLSFLQQDYEAAGRMYRDVVDSIGDRFGWYLYATALAGVGKIEMTLKRFHQAIPWFERSLEVAEPVEAKFFMARSWGELAVCYLGLADPKRALEFAQKADTVLLELGALHSYQVNLADTGNIYLYLGNPVTAISYYQRALALAREIKDPLSVRKWSSNIRLAYAQMLESIDSRDGSRK
jgi:tetratricopeptide (TPR) repeat protein